MIINLSEITTKTKSDNKKTTFHKLSRIQFIITVTHHILSSILMG